MIETYQTESWADSHPKELTDLVTRELENGDVLFFPNLIFQTTDQESLFLTSHILGAKSKNIGYNPLNKHLWGTADLIPDDTAYMKAMMQRFYEQAHSLVNSLFPTYTDSLMIGRTSFRPAQISNRKTSYRKDDKRLHVDAFPASPNQGKRILRVFSNINHHCEPRVWRLGEPFPQVAQKFLPQISRPIPGFAQLLKLLRITKSLRTPYDHYMLYMHDTMKADLDYQHNVSQQSFSFPAHSTWVVFTDQASHAAMSGQHMLEQTFYLPVEAMQDESKSPLRVLEKMLGRKLT